MPRVGPVTDVAICPEPGCPRITNGGRCDTHTPTPKHRPPDRRPGPRQRGYDYQWERTRAAYLSDHPNCEWPGCDQPATDVDHVVPRHLFTNRYAADDETNLQSLCHPHHSRKTATEDGGYGNPTNPDHGQ